MHRAEVISMISRRLELAITISIFFAAFLGRFLETAGRDVGRQSEFMFSNLLFLYLLGYVSFELCKTVPVPDRLLELIRGSALLGLVSFLAPIGIIIWGAGADPTDVAPWWMTLTTVQWSIYGLGIVAGLVRKRRRISVILS